MKTLTNNPRLNASFYSFQFFSQGIAYGLFAVSMPAYLAKNGVSAALIAALLVMWNLPGALKIIGGPIVDRLHFFAMGNRRAWIVFAHIMRLIILSQFLFLSHVPTQLSILGALYFIYNTCHYFEFAALDAQMIETNPNERYNLLSGYTRAAFLIGIIAGAAGLGTVLTHLSNGWHISVTILLAVFTLGLCYSLWMCEKESNLFFSFKTIPAALRDKEKNIRSFKEVFVDLWQSSKQKTHRNFMLYLLLSFIPTGMFYALAPILAVKGFHWSDKFYSQSVGSIYPIMGIIAALIGGWLATRKGSFWILKLAILVGCTSFLAMAAIQPYWQYSTTFNIMLMIGLVSLFALADTFNAIASTGIMMKLTVKRIAGTQFSLFISLYNFSVAIGDAVFGITQHWLNYQQIILGIGLLYIVIIFFLIRIKPLLLNNSPT